MDQPLPMPSGVSDLAVGGYTSVPEPGMVPLLVSMITALMGVGIYRRRKSHKEKPVQ